MIFSLFRKNPRRTTIAILYKRIATASRAPGLYSALGVPDTIEGRFESLSLHMVLILRALRNLPEPAAQVAGDLTDAFFQDLDAAHREMGVGDTSVPKRMKKLAASFFGRARAYDAPLDAADEASLSEALRRNALGGDAPGRPLARYALTADASLKGADLAAILEHGPVFPNPEAFAEEASR